jgi:hypothetical protein
MSSLSPSADNGQPVRVIIEDDKALFFTKINKKSEFYKIDAGIYIAHFYLSCVEEGINPTFCIDREQYKNYNIPDDCIYIGTVRYQK